MPAHESVAHRFSAAYNARDVPALQDCFDPDAEYDDILFGTHVGRASIGRMFDAMLATGTSTWTLLATGRAEHGVVARWRYELTPARRGPAGGVSFEGMSVFELGPDADRCAHYREFFDRTAVWEALGYPPALRRRLAERVPTVRPARPAAG